MKELSKNITDWCRKYYALEDADAPIVEYGIQLFLNTSLKVIGIFVIGAIIGHFKKVVIAMFVFGSIRNFAGGRHCQTDFGCFSVMLCICLSPIPMFPVPLHLAQWIWGGIAVYSLYQVIRYAPRNSTVNPICDVRILKRKRIGSLVVTGMYVLLLIFYSEPWLRWLVAMPLFIEAVTISPVFYKKVKNEGKYVWRNQYL
uniref:accessory gene regulator ArgB-like protein n=1 Tax=Acetatifactor sp. TaxID=1872090 RepID=UPI004056A8C7